MSINVYARITKLHDVCGRIDYISNPARQEHLLAVADTTTGDPSFWADLARESREAWVTSGAAARTHLVDKIDPVTGEKEKVRVQNQCCEAREIQGELPNQIAGKVDLQKLAAKMSGDFRDDFGSDCVLAIHLNKSRTNLHYHLIHSERSLLAEPEIRRATDRAAFIDENGVRKRTKKEILDADGQLRPGCRIVPKGEIISTRRFGEKEDYFSKNAWNQDVKQWVADWINKNLQPDQERVVYDPEGPYLPQIHIGKGRSEEQEARIKEYNTAAKNVNAMIDDGTIDRDEADAVKGYVMLSPDRTAALKDIYSVTLGRKPARPERTRDNGVVGSLKRQLREEYRQAALARNEAASATNSADRLIKQAEARRHSQSIDQIKLQLGLLQAKSEKERQWWEEQQRRQRMKEYWSAKKTVRFYGNRVRSIDKQISRLKQEHWDTGIFDSEGRRRIEAEIRELEKQRDELIEAEAEARAQAKFIKKELKAMARSMTNTPQSRAPEPGRTKPGRSSRER